MPDRPDKRQEPLHGIVVEEARPEVARPPLYQVILLNDDFTPMDFVIVVLETFFNMDRERATQVMLHVHTRGKGVCGVFTREVAETKVTQVNEFARAPAPAAVHAREGVRRADCKIPHRPHVCMHSDDVDFACIAPSVD